MLYLLDQFLDKATSQTQLSEDSSDNYSSESEEALKLSLSKKTISKRSIKATTLNKIVDDISKHYVLLITFIIDRLFSYTN